MKSKLDSLQFGQTSLIRIICPPVVDKSLPCLSCSSQVSSLGFVTVYNAYIPTLDELVPTLMPLCNPHIYLVVSSPFPSPFGSLPKLIGVYFNLKELVTV